MGSVNPYQPLFDRIDTVVPKLEENTDEFSGVAADLLRRLGFALGNLLNTMALMSPSLILPDTDTSEDSGVGSLSVPGETEGSPDAS